MRRSPPRTATIVRTMLVVLWASGCLAPAARSQEKWTDPPTGEQIEMASRRVASALGPFWEETVGIPADAKMAWRTSDRSAGRRVEAVIGGDVRLEIDFDPTSGKIMLLRNRSVQEKAFERARESPGLTSTWTRDVALARGEEILKALYGKVPKDLRISPYHPQFCVSNTDPGTWWIEWTQMFAGYPCADGSVLLCLHEKYGVYSFGDGRRAFDCPTTASISREQALAIGKKTAERAVSKWAEDLAGFTVGVVREGTCLEFPQLQSGELAVVRGNFVYGKGEELPDRPDYADADPDPVKAARLAYVLEFPLQGSKNPSNPKYPPVICVYVDAEDGKVRGGYFTTR